MPTPEIVPLSGLQHGLAKHDVTIRRRAERGEYGPIYLDAKGRQSVSRVIVEAVEGVQFTPEQLHTIRTKPSTPKTYKPRPLPAIDPGPVSLALNAHSDIKTWTRFNEYGLRCVAKRDLQWREYIKQNFRRK